MNSHYVEALAAAARGESLPDGRFVAILDVARRTRADFDADLVSFRANPAAFHDRAATPVPLSVQEPDKLYSNLSSAMRLRAESGGKHWNVAFTGHGLGDNCQFAALCDVFNASGWEIRVRSTPDKQWLWRAAGNPSFDNPTAQDIGHPWYYHGDFGKADAPECTGNKTGYNIQTPYLPDIGSSILRWDDLCRSRPDVRHAIGQAAKDDVAAFFADLPRPIVMVHATGASGVESKSLRPAEIVEFYKRMLYGSPGSIVLLDWKGHNPVTADLRFRRIPDWNVETLAAALAAADLLVGIDSGPAHLARLTDTRTLFVTYPALPARHVALPHNKTRFLIPQSHALAWAARPQDGWENAVYRGDRPTPAFIAEQALELLGIKPSSYEGAGMTEEYVNALRAASRGDVLEQGEFASILRRAYKLPEEFESDLARYRLVPQLFHEQVAAAKFVIDVPPPEPGDLFLRFGHGLGDCCQFIPMLHLYKRRGWHVRVETGRDREWLYQSLGIETGSCPQGATVGWHYAHQFSNVYESEYGGNKTAWNLNRHPLPKMPDAHKALWDEMCEMRLSLKDGIGAHALLAADELFRGVERPVLVHGCGVTRPDDKNIPPEAFAGLLLGLREFCSPFLVGDGPTVEGVQRVRPPSLELLAALIQRAALFIGIDSGPFHMCNFLEAPCLGVFRPKLPPHHCCVPNERAMYLVPSEHRQAWEKLSRLRWNWRMYDELTADAILAAAKLKLDWLEYDI